MMMSRIVKTATIARPQLARAMFTTARPAARVSMVAAFPKRATLLSTVAAPSVAPAATAVVAARSFHASPARSSKPSHDPPFGSKVDATAVVALANDCVTKVQQASMQQLYHWTSYGLAGLAPVAVILSPSFLNFPVDFALGLIIPVHMHIGLVGISEDYVPRPHQGWARLALAVLSMLTAVGLLKINLCGAGITESVKSLWREPKQIEDGKKKGK